jgi:hypothetical protein
MMQQLLGRMTWPRPVPLLWSTADYADIPERIRRTGRLDTDELWVPSSGDGWGAFRKRHGRINDERLDSGGAQSAASKRRAEQAAAAQAEWEAAKRQRQLAKQAQADAEWTAAEAASEAVARIFWGEINAAYASMEYRRVRTITTGTIHGVTLDEGETYYLPLHLIEWIATHGYPDEDAAEQRKQQQATAEREAAQARIQAEEEAQRQRQRQQEKDAIDRVEMNAAREHWGQINPAYATAQYLKVTVARSGVIEGVSLLGGKSYWVPIQVLQALASRPVAA